MRRPSPLPSTPSARPVEPEQPFEPEIHLRDTPGTPVESTGPLADVVPFVAREADAAPEAATDEVDDQPARQLGVRDVWAAARARRRALRREIRRFTVRQRRRRLAWLIGLGSVAVVALGAVAAAYSPMFAVATITVVGTDRLAPAAVEEALAGQLGTPLALVDSSEVKAALVAFPLVETYTLEARPPQELVVRIVERTPIGSIESKAGHTLVDAAGVALATTEGAPEGYPSLDIEDGAGSRAFLAAGTVYRSLPEELRSQVTAITATTANDVTLTIDGADVLWGGAEDSAQKAVVLAAAMVASPPDEVELYDVSSPAAVVIR
ncbi:FtsQ-type POTRA domain-containing protein [Microbacterium dauci]|uniref:FtsQ-type POTRA domain-containing protein n=1 Tax=Microbacterium dauci TaxID=3048008 RepID=A0ABT6ZG68_9MICO|nr:FtsQ-type POTRA domain-containing protein [Microbacterium sp. LX3-4]MDJ1115148.1 FtsQ-type POTRA domain-containing protein [Microbacterium sp. LX3-4]